MRKLPGTLVIVVLITAAAVWGCRHLQFFERLPMVFGQRAFAASGDSDGGQLFRQRNRGRQLPTTSGEGRKRGADGLGRGQGRHAMTVSSEGWLNVLAYLSVFVFFVMLTYYGEQALRKLVNRREACVTTS